MRFREDLPVLRLHSDRGGEFSSDLLHDFCRGEGILWSFTLPASPQKNGVVERCIGLLMEVARTSMIHAAAPYFQWPFAIRYAAHQLNLPPRVSLPETSPTQCWTGKVGDATEFHFYHPTSRRVLPFEDVTFDKSVPFYCLFPYRTAPLPPPPLFLAPGPPPVYPLPPQGSAPSGAEPGGAEPASAELGGAEPEGAEFGGAETEGAEPGGAAGPAAGGTGAGGAGAGGAGAGGAGAGGTGAGGAGAGGAGGGDPRAGGAGVGGARAGGTGAGGTVQRQPFFVPLMPSSRPPPCSVQGASQVAPHTEDYTCGSWVCSFDC
ncbi:unnamed protein product [Closterium sp. NIES-54]